MKVLLVTGGAGFIGSSFIKYFLRRNKNFIIVNMDKLTYAGNISNLKEIEDSPRHHFIKGDICNYELVNYVFKKYRPAYIINFAAESHAARSLEHPSAFAQANIMGTLTLLEAARYIWSKQDFQKNRFLQISTDEVYGGNDNGEDYFTEESPLAPGNPYSASKAGADMMVKAFAKSFRMPVIISRCCNNYGPNQQSENFIPSCILHALRDQPVPVYGDGQYAREWIHVLDHCIAIIRILFYGKNGEIYNIGSGEEVSDIDLSRKVLKMLGKSEDMMKPAAGSPAQEKRCATNSYKISSNLNWSCKFRLDEGLKETVQWYKSNRNLWEE